MVVFFDLFEVFSKEINCVLALLVIFFTVGFDDFMRFVGADGA